MHESDKIDNILKQVLALGMDEQIYLLKKITDFIQERNSSSNPQNLSMLSGLGTEIWKDIEVDKYINSEREWQ